MNNYKILIATHVQKYILNNNMEFGEDEYYDVIANLCLLEHLKIRSESTGFGDLAKTISSTNIMIEDVQIEAQKLFPALYTDKMELELSSKIFDWVWENNAKNSIINFNLKYYNTDVSELINDYF